MREVIERVEKRVKEILSGESTGHDWYHIDQVRKTALQIAEKEGGDKEIIELTALVHDVGDHKFFASKDEGQRITNKVLEECGVSVEVREKVMDIVTTMSFSTGKIPESLEGKIVQDADRVYALGAIGIARAFAFGGKKDRLIHDPSQPRDFPSTLNHFYDKLLLLKDKMNTATGKEIASGRHAYMEDFLEQFYSEWEGRE